MRRGESGINCLIAVDKPLGLSSHDVVGRVRRALGERRVGHAGTLDPAATGVLVVGVGQATRLLGMLTLDDKRYEALVAFGAETTTDDAEGEVLHRADVPERLAEHAVAQVIVSSLVGTCEQVPPAYSAISIDGRRSYARARAGETVELPARTVTVYDAHLIDLSREDALVWRVGLHVSKGTYVRSIARDLGRSLGTAAHLAGLRRVASGPVGIDDCVTLEALEKAGAAGIMDYALDPLRTLALPWHRLNEYELRCVENGRRFSCRSVCGVDGEQRVPEEGEQVSLVDGARLMGVWIEREGRLASVASFPAGIGGVRT